MQFEHQTGFFFKPTGPHAQVETGLEAAASQYSKSLSDGTSTALDHSLSSHLVTLNPKAYTLYPIPYTLNPKTLTSILKPQTLNQFYTLNP
jgi:hypothetical protein